MDAFKYIIEQMYEVLKIDGYIEVDEAAFEDGIPSVKRKKHMKNLKAILEDGKTIDELIKMEKENG